VSRQATVALHGNRYELDPALEHRRVELVFDPFDLEHVRVRFQGRPMGEARPLVIGRHVHPRARREPTEPSGSAPTGIDYLGLIEARHRASKEHRIDYRTLQHHNDDDEQQEEGQR
jgi:putative transposase